MKRTSLLVVAAGAVGALAVTGTALAAMHDDVTPRRPTAAASSAPDVDARRAAEVALARTGGGQVVEVEREFEHGRQAWTVKIVKNGVRYEIHVDAATGEVVRAGADARGGRDDAGTDDRHGRGRDDAAGDDKGGLRPGGATDDRGYDDKGGLRPDGATDDRGYDDNGGRGGDDRGGRGGDDR